jgi:ribosome biogenesis GTPase
MRLESLGFDSWFREKLPAGADQQWSPVRVVSVERSNCIVTDGDRTIAAELTGKMLFNADSPLDFPAVGDWVLVQTFDNQGLALIHGILPRKTLLKRKVAGKRSELQLIAANLDIALIVQALDVDFNLRRLERYLVMVNDSGIAPVVLLSKADLAGPGEVEEKKAGIQELMPGTRVVAFSSKDEGGLESIVAELTPGRTYCLLGSSGVGKTTLINRLIGRDEYLTLEVRARDGRGQHATTRRQLILLESGAMIVDTPGMRELGNIEVEAGIEETFADILELGAQCRFNDCSHSNEAGCAVRAAIDDGRLLAERFAGYQKLQKEAEYNARSYREARERDKKFGKHCKAVLKGKKKEKY